MPVDTHENETTTYTFPGGWKLDIEGRLDSLKQLSESDAVKRFQAECESEYEVIVTVTERRKA
jgi:competence protein ComGC